jgi:hypothetical protein
VEGLIWGVPLGARPDCIPVSRPRGAKALGVKYEKALAGALPGWKHGQWFQFKDINGYGYCQVDLMIELEACVIVLEAKPQVIGRSRNSTSQCLRRFTKSL